MVKQNEDIKGLRKDGHEIKSCFFADDATFFVKGSESLDELQCVIEKFSNYTSLKLNLQKSQLAFLGSKTEAKNVTMYKGKFQCVNLYTEAIKILGINFTYDMCSQKKMNFDRALDKFKLITYGK